MTLFFIPAWTLGCSLLEQIAHYNAVLSVFSEELKEPSMNKLAAGEEFFPLFEQSFMNAFVHTGCEVIPIIHYI
jgi:hypothetical protein